jgi:hypothetical protein
MRWLLRPSTLVALSVLLAAGAVALVSLPRSTENRAIPQPLPEGDQEVVWLFAATNATPWERFVAAVGTAVRRLQTDHPDVALRFDAAGAFPAQTTAVPELTISVRGSRGRLRFRWYKLTSDQKTADWVRALVARRPAPLAIIGGSSSDLATELAESLRREALARPEGAGAPLLILTAATADDVPQGPGESARVLTGIYPGRTYRFCFTNRQMAVAVTDFIWSRPDLRPDVDPLYLAFWQDDVYSLDLTDRFLQALHLPAALAAARDWGWLASRAATGGPFLDPGSLAGFRLALDPRSERIEYSVGTFDRPNPWEAEAASALLDARLNLYPSQRRPLLVIAPAASQAARRFLRGMERTAPVEARRFVVATGDAIPFNTVYRDRNVAWPIQDLPFTLVFFTHRNPADAAAGFRETVFSNDAEPGVGGAPTSGTEDLLLDMDIVETLVQAAYREGKLVGEAGELCRRLAEARWSRAVGRVTFSPELPLLFDADGNRQSGTGEHVVLVRPIVEGAQVQPRAQIEVWAWQMRDAPGRRRWQRQALLSVEYDTPAGLAGSE